MKFNKHERKQLLKWAGDGLRGVRESAAFVALWDDQGPLSETRVEFYLQVGAAVVMGKPFVLTVPHGQTIPDKMRKIADRIVYYNPADPESIKHGLAKAMNEIGLATQ